MLMATFTKEKTMHQLIKATDFTREKLEKLFVLADKIEKNPKKYRNSLKGSVVATLFFEPSTRTRLSFESAILRLGGSLLSTENAGSNSSGIKGESIEDTMHMMAGYSDCVIMRHGSNDSAECAVKAQPNLPFINAGSGGKEHPTQAILDVYTLRQIKGKIEGLSVAIVGDLKYGRTCHSLIKMLSLYDNIEIWACPVRGLELPEEYVVFMKERGMKYFPVSSLSGLNPSVDAIYQTRIQRERVEDKSIDLNAFVINKKVMARFSENTLLLHPLPRVDEISTDIDGDKRAVYFKQAHYGIPTRMALLLSVMGKAKL